MSETDYSLQSQVSAPAAYAAKSSGGRPRPISSCWTCRRRKVKCDHAHPVCSSCNRGNHVCTWSEQIQATTGSGRVWKPIHSGSGKAAKNGDVQARLDRLELLLEKALATQGTNSVLSIRSSTDGEISESEAQLTPTSTSQISHGGGIASDDDDGTLVINGEKSQFVSSHHYSLLAEEIQDIKVLLGDKTDEGMKEIPQSPFVDLLSLGRAHSQSSLQQLLPGTQDHRDALLDIYFANVEPIVRIMHKPTIIRKFLYYNREAHPISFAVYFSAINSLPPKVVLEEFGESKETLLDRFQLGIEMALARENYLTTTSLEIFQGFILWLTCITREEDIGKAWVLLGLAYRIALNLGLHRDPSLFPAGSMDTITIELRRRAWYHFGHMEFRAAECKGQEPGITEDSYTTLFPRNIDDEDLVEGAIPGQAPYDKEKFTTMTFQLVRCMGMRALRRVVQSTYRLERRMLDSGLQGTSRPDSTRELQTLYEQIKVTLDEVHAESQRKYLRHLDPELPMQRLTLGLAPLLEWRCYLLFWLRMPRAYRDTVFSEDVRRSIFGKSVSCIEALNGAASDVDTARFKWHIGYIASFQAIMHVLSELRTPLIDGPDRQRALSALQICRNLRENNTAKTWQVVKNMIDKAVAEYSPCSTRQEHDSSTYVSTIPTISSSPQRENTQSNGVPMSLPMDLVQSYPSQQFPLSSISQTSIPLQPQPLHQVRMESLSTLQDPIAPSWDDLNLSHIANIVGNIPPAPGVIPDSAFGYWGDPFNYESETAIPLTDSYFPIWSG